MYPLIPWFLGFSTTQLGFNRSGHHEHWCWSFPWFFTADMLWAESQRLETCATRTSTKGVIPEISSVSTCYYYSILLCQMVNSSKQTRTYKNKDIYKLIFVMYTLYIQIIPAIYQYRFPVIQYHTVTISIHIMLFIYIQTYYLHIGILAYWYF